MVFCLCGGCNVQFQYGRVTGICCFKYLCIVITINQLLLIMCEAKQWVSKTGMWKVEGRYFKFMFRFVEKERVSSPKLYEPKPSLFLCNCSEIITCQIITFFNLMFFYVFSTVHHSIELFHQPTLMHNFLYSLTILFVTLLSSTCFEH